MGKKSEGTERWFIWVEVMRGCGMEKRWFLCLRVFVQKRTQGSVRSNGRGRGEAD